MSLSWGRGTWFLPSPVATNVFIRDSPFEVVVWATKLKSGNSFYKKKSQWSGLTPQVSMKEVEVKTQ